MLNLKGKRVIVTGSTGFLGQHVLSELEKSGAQCIGFSSTSWDLLNSYVLPAVLSRLKEADYIINLAGFNGNIEFNLKYPAEIYVKNTTMAINLFEACRKSAVKNVISTLASCAYGDLGYDTLYENKFTCGLPHESVRGHGLAKRNIHELCQLYSKQYGLNYTTCIPTTIYGEGDSFDPLKSKVVGSLIRKIVEAKRTKSNFVELLGTGNALRELIYVEDAAEYIVKAMYSYNISYMPINIGSNQEVSIRELAQKIAEIAEYKGGIKFNGSSDGQLRKKLSTDRQFKSLGEINFTPLEEGLSRTVEYYERNH